MTRSQRTFFITVLQALGLLISVCYGGYRYSQIQSLSRLPDPAIEPVRIVPRHQDSRLITDDDLLRTLQKLTPKLAGANPSINHVDHALRFWGIAATFDDPECLSGVQMRELLLDHRSFATAWGSETEPFLQVVSEDSTGLMFRTRQGAATSSHVDHTLAGLAEVQTPADYPVLTSQGEMPLRDAVIQSLREFRLNQEEYEWSALVWLLYYPNVREWTTSGGQRVSWDLLAERMMRQRLAQGVCFGQHRLYVLALLLCRDEEQPLLSTEMRQRVIGHLQDVTSRLSAAQNSAGYWDASWPGDEWDGIASTETGPLGSQADRILATGHVLEWWLFAPDEVLPSREIIAKASDWLVESINDLTPQETRRFYPFLTHAGRALALWHGVEPSAALQESGSSPRR